MILGLSIYFILMDFYVFSILGWVYESTFVSIRTGKPVNRGFLYTVRVLLLFMYFYDLFPVTRHYYTLSVCLLLLL